jgi:ATP-dependent DNA helicase PIF1
MTDQFKQIIDLSVKNGRNVFLNGPGGCGKTYTIKELIRHFKLNGIHYAATALTGTAAFNFGGKTIHSFAFGGYGDGKPADVLRKIPFAKKKIINATKILIIDEVSMLGASLLETLNYVFKCVRKSDFPFGGMTLIVSGDFLQLPPVKDAFAFTSPVWNELRFVRVDFSTPYRFEDPKYFEMLQRIRIGTPTENDYKRLEYRRMDIYDILPENTLIKPTKIYSRRDNVAQENETELAKIALPAYTFIAEDSLMYERRDTLIPIEAMTPAERAEVTAQHGSFKIKDHEVLLNSMSDQTVILKETAQAMLNYNVDIETGKINGSRCVISKINESGVYATFLDGETMLIPQVTITRMLPGGLVACRKQLPLMLGYAITVHKCQGASLDSAIIDLGKTIFDYSQAYVALSRVRKLDGLYLTDFARNSIKSHPAAVAFEVGGAARSPKPP